MKMRNNLVAILTALLSVVMVLSLFSGCARKRRQRRPPPLPHPAAVVPELQGMTPEEAAVALARHMLRLGRTVTTDEARWADRVRPGVIVAQSETPGARLPRRSAVEITVYRPAGREYGDVPDVQGMTYAEAVAALDTAGFLVGDVTWRHIDQQQLHGLVYVQTPGPGVRAKRWSKVDLGVYGPAAEGFVRVPSLTGLAADDVPLVLAKHGLAQGEVTYEPAPCASLVGTVRAQSPGVGVKVKPGATVDITVYSR